MSEWEEEGSFDWYRVLHVELFLPLSEALRTPAHTPACQHASPYATALIKSPRSIREAGERGNETREEHVSQHTLTHSRTFRLLLRPAGPAFVRFGGFATYKRVVGIA